MTRLLYQVVVTHMTTITSRDHRLPHIHLYQTHKGTVAARPTVRLHLHPTLINIPTLIALHMAIVTLKNRACSQPTPTTCHYHHPRHIRQITRTPCRALLLVTHARCHFIASMT